MNLLDDLPEKLTRDEEFKLAARIQKSQNEDDLNRLVLQGMREAFLYMKHFCRKKIEDDEIFSLCYRTLLRNAKRFRPGGIRFIAFCKAGIRGAVCRYWTTVSAVRNSTEVISLDVPENLPGADGLDHTDLSSSLTHQTIEFDFASINIKETFAVLKTLMKDRLTKQEQMIMALVYENGFNFQEIGCLLGVTRSAAQAHHAKAIRKLRQEVEKRGLLS